MKIEIVVDGRPVRVDEGQASDVREVSPGIYSILRDGRSYEVRVTKNGDSWRAMIGERTFAVEITDPRNASKRSGATLGHAHQDVKAPMPGKVVRMLVREGDEVAGGQGLAVVEAMKMQNELKALRAGRVVRVAVKDGDTVAAGDVLISLE